MKRSVGIELRSLTNLIMRQIEYNGTADALERISGANIWIIGYLAACSGQDVFQRDLEDAFGVTRSTASKVVNRMVQMGLIQRESVAYDARLKKLSLTAKAHQLVDLMQKNAAVMDDRLTKGFSPEELETLFQYIERMKQNFQPSKSNHSRQTENNKEQ